MTPLNISLGSLEPTPAVIPRPASARAIRSVASRWPRHDEDEIAAVVDVLRSGRVNGLHHGERTAAFETAFADKFGMPHGVAVANGTVALEIALRALGVGVGDEVIVPARSFVATASCVVAVGARPVFADVDAQTQGLSAATVERCISPLTRAVIVVHLGGCPADADELAALCARRGLALIEDCAQAHGATLNGRPVGCFGDASAFSFCTDKIMSTGGEGGMLLVRDEATYLRAWSLKDHGKDRRTLGSGPPGAAFRWLHDSFGSNYRLTEMQAAIGLAQLRKLPRWLAARRRNASALSDALHAVPLLRLPRLRPGAVPAWYKFYAFIDPTLLRDDWTRERIVETAQRQGVPCHTGSCPEIYRERAFIEAGLGPQQPLHVARLLGETSIMLPLDQTLDEEECRYMGQVLAATCLKASC